MKYILAQDTRIVRRSKPRKRTYAVLGIFTLLFVYAAMPLAVDFYNDVKFKPAFAPTVKKAYAKTIEAPKPPKTTDPRIENVYNKLASINSPLANYAEALVKEADKNDIPWSLVYAISGKESSFGIHIKEGSHNAWGIMSWDAAGKRSIRMFNSWEESIAYEAKLLGDNYRENMYRGIQEKYCPSFECSNTWVEDVAGFSAQVNK